MSGDPSEERLELARQVGTRLRNEHGRSLRALGVYGSVSHGTALPNSDLELLAVMGGSIEIRPNRWLEADVLVDCRSATEERLVEEARRIGPDWGVKADSYRHQFVIRDPDSVFPRLREASLAIPEKAFKGALEESRWDLHEARDKVRNGLALDDRVRAVAAGWDFAWTAAMRVALLTRKPYESKSTLWAEVGRRGYRMRDLLDTLANGRLGSLGADVERAWSELSAR